MFRILSTYLVLVLARRCLASNGLPTLVLDNGTFVGNSSGRTSQFLGIPFANPPYVRTVSLGVPHLLNRSYRTGDLRFRLPVPVDPYEGTYNATAYGFSCVQQSSALPNLTGVNPVALVDLSNFVPQPFTQDDEDCWLFILSVYRTSFVFTRVPQA